MGVFLNRRLQPSLEVIPASPQKRSRPLTQLLKERLARTFPSFVPNSEQRLVRALNIQKSRSVAESLLQLPPSPQTHLLAGGEGLGKATVLRSLGEIWLSRNFGVLALERPDDLESFLAQLEAGTDSYGEQIKQDIQYCLVRRAWEKDAGALSVLRSCLPSTTVVVACSPLCARALKQSLGTGTTRWELQPIEREDARLAAWRIADAPDPEALAQWSSRSALHRMLAGTPLFIQLASRVGLPERLPRIGLLIAEFIDAVGRGIEREFGSPTGALEVLARIVVEEGITSFSLSSLLELERQQLLSISPSAEPFGGLDSLLRRLCSTGLLEHIPPDRFEFRHPYFATVIVARVLAREPENLSKPISLAERGIEREIALLLPAFATNGAEALDRMTEKDDHLWLAGLPLLPTKELLRHRNLVLDRLKATLFGAGTARATHAIAQHDQKLVDSLGDSGFAGLLMVLAELEIPDPTLLGVVLHALEHHWAQRIDLRPLLSSLLSHLGDPPQRPSTYEPHRGDNFFAIADHAVSNQQFGLTFQDALSSNRYSQGPKHPRTDVNWFAAYAFARWLGGRLPTREEYERLMPRFSPHQISPDVLNTKDTCKRLVPGGRGTLEVYHRLERAPDPGSCLHLLGNVREWCLDSPPDKPEFRWTLGGSFDYRPGNAEREAAHNHFADVGFRVCWDEPEQTSKTILLPTLPHGQVDSFAINTIQDAKMPFKDQQSLLSTRASSPLQNGAAPQRLPVQVYICYAAEDVTHLQELRKHLVNLERQGNVSIWSEADLKPGQVRETESTKHQQSAQIMIPLVSPDFMSNDRLHAELTAAFARVSRSEIRLFPILVRLTDLVGSGLDALQLVPSHDRPINTWNDPDAAWVDTIKKLRPMIDQLQKT